jgi:FtsP/CotA-like multicopper oxidase with cupredoxin domain
MRTTKMANAIGKIQLLLALFVAVTLFSLSAQAAAPGITGPTFNLTAEPAYLTQPDGQMVYSWGYGCNGAPSGSLPDPSMGPNAGTMPNFNCPTMQVPGPTLIVREGDSVTVNLKNNLPSAAGNTSILFPGFQVTTTNGVAGLLTHEAAPGQSVTYTFKATSPGTRAYYSGTQGDLQVEMGLYGAIIVLPTKITLAQCSPILQSNINSIEHAHGEYDYALSLAHAAYDTPSSCYDREYLFQFSEIDPRIHTQAEAQAIAKAGCTAGAPGCSLQVATEPYHPAYFMINGRSMPDDMDPNYAPQYPHQPYNGNPHMHPGELVLLRIIGQDRWQHPFHEHGNHVRILGRDGNLIVSQSDSTQLAGPLLFTTTTTPGLAMDGIYYWTGRGLNWDPYGHNPGSQDSLATLPCYPDANGYNTGYDGSGNLTHPEVQTAINYYEWCQDHNKPVQVSPFGDVAAGGPVTLPDPNLFTNGPWYGGSPYLGPDATLRATGCMPSSAGQTNSPGCGASGSTPPSGTIANSPSAEAGFAFMWHSHNEREITTNNMFPGGMLMMMLVDSREFPIDESN